MIKIGENFSLAGIFNIDQLSTLPEVLHEYGSDFNNISLDEFLWMTYSRPDGSISFTRNTYKFCPDLISYVKNYFETIIDIPFNPERVHFLRTVGNIEPHKDEANRACCINIGVKNSNTAVTKVSVDNNRNNFEGTCESFICQDGNAYLLNTQNFHSVDGTMEQRLMITYGFSAPFDTICGRIRK